MNLAAEVEPTELPDDAAHLLVIDDDSRIRSLLSRFLQNGGYRVTVAASAEEARRHLAGMSFDLLIVDVMMPGENGMDLVASLRKSDDVPILMLTARSEAESRVRGLELGADDYLAKPFEPRELLLRISNILKRGVSATVREVEFVRFGPFTFHFHRKELRRGNEPVRLTDREREMLLAFAQRPGETVPRHELLSTSDASGERTVDVQVNRLRRKIEADPSNPIHLQTVRGIGYRLLVD
ncbi:response regulator [Afifella pfennigii]|uniref:response regulator n=1 Tax=Afifella pfennigii TaxID=209897 RepID=UPI00068EC7C5|nr:response regulator transcription factor [Afifella pfennigii]